LVVVRSRRGMPLLILAAISAFTGGCGSGPHAQTSPTTGSGATGTPPTTMALAAPGSTATPTSPATLTSPGTPGTSGLAPSATHPCGSLPAAPRYTHVIWIFMENHSYDRVIGSPNAPYINSLAGECGLATGYHNVTHPSLPNYVAATSGLNLARLAPFTPDCSPTPECTANAQSIFAQGESWKAYEESMPSNCDRSDAGEYAVRHNPPAYYAALRGCSSLDVPYSTLGADLDNRTLPSFSFITPNLIDDMHDGSLADGDTWLAHNLPPILNSPEYREATTAVFLTWDEGEGGSSNDCAANTSDVGCHVATIVISPSTGVGTRSADLFNHYSLLATAEALLGLPKLGEAAANPSMVSAFNL
jgi:phospholipase C